MTPPPAKATWTGLLLAYARERLTPAGCFPPLLVVTATLAGKGWTGPAALAADAVLALALVITFRIWDDLMDRERDRETSGPRRRPRAIHGPAGRRMRCALLTVALWTIADSRGSNPWRFSSSTCRLVDSYRLAVCAAAKAVRSARPTESFS